jgi:hypothetical protein
MPPANEVETQIWRNSTAQSILRGYLQSGEIPLDGSMKPKEVWDVFCVPHPEFVGFVYKNKFANRLRYMRKQLVDKDGLADDDNAALVHDRLLFPAPTHNHRGEPRWPGSEAERFLKLDIDACKHEMMAPLQLHGTRAEYYENYPLAVFRKHIHQEVRLRKFILQYYNR